MKFGEKRVLTLKLLVTYKLAQPDQQNGRLELQIFCSLLYSDSADTSCLIVTRREFIIFFLRARLDSSVVVVSVVHRLLDYCLSLLVEPEAEKACDSDEHNCGCYGE